MSGDKYDKLLNAAIVLLIASASVLGYSVYNTHFSKNNATTNLNNANGLRDSLKTVYNTTVTSIDTSLVESNKVSNPELEEKYKEVDALKAEINKLLLSEGDGNIASAQQKIQELQQKITDLEIRYQDAAEQNRRLQERLEQLKADRNNQTFTTKTSDGSVSSNPKQDNQTKNITSGQKVSTALNQLVNQATEMSFYATTSNGETQTTKISVADKLFGSFLFKYTSPYNTSEPVYIVIIQPDGKTIKGPSWDIGVFDSDEGKKVFTKKIMLELNGEPQKVNFNVLPDDFIAGPYTMEIWYKKNLIGTKVRTLL
jgi:hypothetical protein